MGFEGVPPEAILKLRTTTMSPESQKHLHGLSAYFAQNRERLLTEWRRAADSDSAQTTVSALSRSQFNNHIPQLLTIFEEELRDGDQSQLIRPPIEEIKHGLQRWQQGYQLPELMREWDHLHNCMADLIAEYARRHPGSDCECYHFAYAKLRRLVGSGVIESSGQYARLQQEAAAGNVNSLKTALAKLQSVENHRAELFRQTVHDLRTNVQSASMAAEILGADGLEPSERGGFASSIQEGLSAVSAMLEDLMQLARLEAGLEKRKIAPLDAGELILTFCATVMPLAQRKGLGLTVRGPDLLNVEGDAQKIRRILQNLVGNALKYTDAGGVTVSWGGAEKAWWFSVKDTGPGMNGSKGPPIVEGLQQATESARESAHARQPMENALVTMAQTSDPKRRKHRGGEGVGLSIVKRLCELLDASIELETSPSTGTFFKVRLPIKYHP